MNSSIYLISFHFIHLPLMRHHQAINKTIWLSIPHEIAVLNDVSQVVLFNQCHMTFESLVDYVSTTILSVSIRQWWKMDKVRPLCDVFFCHHISYGITGLDQ